MDWWDQSTGITGDRLFILHTIFCIAVLLIMCYYERPRNAKKYKMPPGPRGVPVLGYMPFLGSEPYKKLHKLKDTYGNIFSINMGQTLVVILGDFEAVKDAFSKSTTTDRPERLFDLMPDAVGFSSVNGEEWVEQRKFCVKSMREHGIGRDKWESTIQTEVEDFIQTVSSYDGKPFEFGKIVTSSVSNNMTEFVLGKRLPFDHPDRTYLDQALDDVMQCFSQSSVYRFFPILYDLAGFLGIGTPAENRKKMVKFNNFFRNEVKKIKEVYKDGKHECFVVDYLKEIDNHEGEEGHYFNETNLYGNIQALFLGGSDTTRTSIIWLILAMAKFTEIQAKIQDEVDSVLGKDEYIQWSHRKEMPYTYATILEGQRWRTIAPLNTARIATEDITVQKYDIQKGTTIIANNWGLHNDTKYWEKPEMFDPQRFITEDGTEVKTKLDSYVPFSYGKRNCPGEVIALMEMFIYFTAIMRKFTIIAPEGKEVNLEGKLGLTYQAYPQDLCFIPRQKKN